MKRQNIVAFRIKINECKDLQTFYKDIIPNNYVSSISISQTLGDQIWIWFEFANKKDKNNYLKEFKSKNMKVLGLKWSSDKEDPHYDPNKWFMHNEKIFTQKFVDHWTKN